MKRRRLVVVAAATTVALSLAACGGDGAEGEDSADRPYRVLVTGGLSAEGALADNAATSVLAAQASVKNINAKGGILGRQVEITVVDDGADPTTAVTKLREAIATKKPDLVLNSGPSTVADAMLPVLKQNKILSFNIGPTETSSDPKAFPLNFDLSPSAVDYARGIAAHADETGHKKIGVLHGSSSYGEAFGKAMESAVAEAGGTLVKKEVYDVKALDMTPQLAAIRAQNPDVLILDAYGAPVGYVLQGLQKLGWDVPIIGNNSVAATGVISTPQPTGLLGTDLVENLTMQVFKSTKHDPSDTRVNEAVATMAELGEIKSTLILAYNYDTLSLVAAAAEQVGSLDDPEKLAKALESKEVQQAAETAILKSYNFTAESHSPNSGPEEFAFIPPSERKDGQFQ